MRRYTVLALGLVAWLVCAATPGLPRGGGREATDGPPPASYPAAGTSLLAAGAWHTCWLTETGSVRCWGYNAHGQLGDGTTNSASLPVVVVGLPTPVAAVAAGEAHTCALTSRGGVKCWGYNVQGQLGDATLADRETPTDVVGLTEGVTAIAAGDYHTCAVVRGGDVACWGYNAGGQLGDGTTTSRSTPVAVRGLRGRAVSVAAGAGHTCALMATGAVMCWGANGEGELGDGTTSVRPGAVSVAGLTGATAITAGSYHTCAVVDEGGLRCWGWNEYGQLGDGTTARHATPVAVTGLGSPVDAVTAGAYHTCVVTSGWLRCWGFNSRGQIGDGTMLSRLAPVSVPGAGAAVEGVAGGAYHTCALTGATVHCWGWNTYGQLGDGTTESRLAPVDAGLPSDASSA